MKKAIKSTIKLCAFISIANLPFITITQLAGIDTFLDSFENTGHYIYLQSQRNSMEPNIKEGDYIILQKSSHPDFTIQQQDIILYCKDSGETVYQRVHHINCIDTVKRYHIIDNNNNHTDKPIYENQIIGKVVSIVDNNLWNIISIKIWEVSIHNLNIGALFTNH
jgi:hypothetical protein